MTLTAPAGESGKAVAALALARIAALRGLRVLLLDADSGRLAPSGPGLGGVLQGLALSGQMLKDRRTHAYLLAAAPAIWPDRRTAALLNYLKQNSDLILVDAVPPRSVGPWPALARLSDSIVLYAGAGGAKPDLDETLRSLVAMDAPLKGLVLAR